MRPLTERNRGVNGTRWTIARILGVLAGAFLAALAAVATVWAHDHRVPRANLHVSGVAKTLHPWSYEWVSGSGSDGCAGIAVDGIPNFKPRADVRVHPGLRVVFRKSQRPRRVHALASRHLADDGYLANARRLPVKLRKRDRGEHSVWVAAAHPTVRHRLFVDISAHWRDVDGCGGDQNASWDFGLKHD
jgi:hypothetical protein